MDIYDALTSVDWSRQEEMLDNYLIRYDTVPTYETFVRECLIPNRAALFTVTCKLTEGWPCRNQWLTDDQTQPDFDRLIGLYGCWTVPVTKCSTTDDYQSDKNKLSMSFDQFVRLWRDPTSSSDYYCKDWHLQKVLEQQELPSVYTVPIYFQSDWLNEMCLVENQDDFRFVYMGGDGTFTPEHIDVLASYSWSANICGEKHWRFTSPIPFEIIQRAGEVIFVPSQWQHHVKNIGSTISINHNWFNAFNIRRIWQHLCTTLVDIEHRIDDCRSLMSDTWYSHCQLILQTNEGLNFGSFYKLLYCIATHRMNNMNDSYAKFDLWTIEKLIREMLKNGAFLHAYDFDLFIQRPKALIKQIHSCIDEQKQTKTATTDENMTHSKNDGPS